MCCNIISIDTCCHLQPGHTRSSIVENNRPSDMSCSIASLRVRVSTLSADLRRPDHSHDIVSLLPAQRPGYSRHMQSIVSVLLRDNLHDTLL